MQKLFDIWVINFHGNQVGGNLGELRDSFQHNIKDGALLWLFFVIDPLQVWNELNNPIGLWSPTTEHSIIPFHQDVRHFDDLHYQLVKWNELKWISVPMNLIGFVVLFNSFVDRIVELSNILDMFYFLAIPVKLLFHKQVAIKNIGKWL